jgi:predicted RNase H-like nuclease (RuvC/YqgF family)
MSDERDSSTRTESLPRPQPKNDQELKKLQIQNQILETQVKDSHSKITNLENKLAELSKAQKAPTTSSEEGSRVKLTQLETSLKKLTSDLAEARSQVAESKKESNKLRQEKTALQNQLDKLSKDANKGKLGVKKGKVA